MTTRLNYSPPSFPAGGYTQAVERLSAWLAEDPFGCNPDCLLRWWEHGQRQPVCVVFLHGYTSGPRQFYQLGELFFQYGCNVIVPRFPGHGLQDRNTGALSGLTAEQLVATACRAIDIAHGLGDQVVVAGLSMGGVVAGWVAQFRPDVSLAVLISPGFCPRILSPRAVPLATRLALVLPNRYLWWDPVLKDTPRPPLYAYPRMASRGLAQVMRLGLVVQRQARHSPPLAQRILVITNPADQSVSNEATENVVAGWKASGARNLSSYSFDAALKLPHDLISPEQPDQNVTTAHPILLQQIMAALENSRIG
jgi:carboxylesterase